jgi:hypothetical protein
MSAIKGECIVEVMEEPCNLILNQIMPKKNKSNNLVLLQRKVD